MTIKERMLNLKSPCVSLSNKSYQKATPRQLFGDTETLPTLNHFSHPSGSIEVTRNKKTYVTWRNELVEDPVACQQSNFSSSNPGCQYLLHILQDYNGTPVIDQSLHWAAPNQLCASGAKKTDCDGATTDPYFGPIPMVPHVHGSHVEPRSDGYPESWFLPKASNIPAGYATEGTYFKSRYLPSQGVPDDGNKYVQNPSAGDVFFQPAADAARGQGYAVFRYTNDQDTTSLWYHDHSLGMTRLNVYAAGAGFWFIRDPKDGENLLAPLDAKKKPQSLPGPAPKIGQDPNGNLQIRKQIREVPIAIQDQSFYSDGRLFYPANRNYFDYPDCNDGGDYDGDTLGLPYKPKSDISPTWNPEAFFDTTVVNGNTFPKFTVAPERYRLRLLNACDSRTVNLAFKLGSLNGTDLPFFVIGSDQGLLPHVVLMRTGFSTVLQPGKPVKAETPAFNPLAALLMGPAERYDVIVDFGGLADGTEVYIVNSGPDFPYGGFDEDGFEPADEDTVGQIMKFVVDSSLKKGPTDLSTSPYDLILSSAPRRRLLPPPVLVSKQPPPPKGPTPKTLVRDLSVFEFDSNVCVNPPSPDDPCNITVVECNEGIIDPLTGFSSLTYGPTVSRLGHDGRLGPGKLVSQRWSDPINQNPPLGATEIWEFWNWTEDGHPLHVHLVGYRILGRYDMSGKQISGPYPFETGLKDTVVALPGIVTRIELSFDIAGLYVWHCHILSHEDNDMMIPFCVGRQGVDCPAELF